MKRKDDPRHKNRQKVVQLLFSKSFEGGKSPHSDPKVSQIFLNKEEVDTMIGEAAPEFPIDKINKIDLAILRLAVFELTIEKTNPEKVVIDEAIELGKEFGGDTSPSFINGVLGKILHSHGKKRSRRKNH